MCRIVVEKVCENCGLSLGERPPLTKYCLRVDCVKEVNGRWAKKLRDRTYYKYEVFVSTKKYIWAKGLLHAEEVVKEKFGKKAKVEFTGLQKRLKRKVVLQ